ncbi:MAG: glycosyl hydrolase family 8 [Candidatus Paceibacterota bacterium]
MHTLISTIKRMPSFLYTHKTLVLLLSSLVLSASLHGINMLNFPYYESDEGTYTSQAWAVTTQGELSPYTYWYDHPPFGWLMIAGWFSILPGEHFTFGTSIDTARVLMFLLHIGSSILLFYSTKKITRSDLASFLAVFIFSVTPLGIYFQRRVLLDNILIFWLLASIAVLLKDKLTLREYLWSGFFYALAFLTKISAAMFGPAILFLVFAIKDTTHRGFRVATWLGTSILTTMTFLLYSFINGEFFPPKGDGDEHVSLLGSILFQMSRGNKVPFYNTNSDFMLMLQDWLSRDMVFITASTISVFILTLLILVRRNKSPYYLFLSLSVTLYLLFLIRGGIVINLYVIPLIPIFSMIISVVSVEIGNGIAWIWKIFHEKIPHHSKPWTRHIMKNTMVSGTLVYIILTTALWYGFGVDKKFLYADEVSNQKSAIAWIKNNLPEQADIIIDSIMLVELRDPGYINQKVFSNAEWFYKVSRDPAIRFEKYNDNWRTLDYVALTHEMLKQIGEFTTSDIVLDAYNNSLPIAKWFEGSSSFIDENKKITTNGDWAMIYAINDTTKNQLVDSWQYYKENFIHSYGQTIDPFGDVTTSEGQSYAMLRSVWMNDEEAFKGSWLWTQHHLQHRLDDNLISWKWQNNKLSDSANATDADQDIALALLFASKAFREPQYLTDAQEIINDIWQHSVVKINGTLYLLPSTISHAQRVDGLLFNPSYISPAHYRIFAQIDTTHDWNKLADDSYTILGQIQTDMHRATPLQSNWYLINTKTGSLSSAQKYIGGSADHYGYDAFRTTWRVWLDYAWFNSEDAQEFLTPLSTFTSNRTDGTTRLATVINPSTGEGIAWNNSLAVQTAHLLSLASLEKNKITASVFYSKLIEESYNEEGYWGDKENYYDQNWVWFTSAVYNNDVYNLWEAY